MLRVVLKLKVSLTGISILIGILQQFVAQVWTQAYHSIKAVENINTQCLLVMHMVLDALKSNGPHKLEYYRDIAWCYKTNFKMNLLRLE